ncbi:MAG: hypothetical protein KF805_11370 [Phycisphaeraceae bacterium]|nr:hypothetical protein [Phycisphaeraceae bacterium]
MLVEHEFITTLEADEAFSRAEKGLIAMGFERIGVFDPVKESRPCTGCGYDLRGIDMKLPCPECGVRPHLARRVEFAKGAKRSRKSMFLMQQDPQRVFVEFDRGKISVAASIEPYRKAEALHGEMMVLIARRTEGAVRGEDEASDAEWQDLLLRIKKRDFRKKLRQWIMLGVVGLIILLLIAALVWGVTH